MFIVLPYGQTKRLTMGKSRVQSVGRFRFLIFEHPSPYQQGSSLPPTPPPGFRYFCREGNKHEGKN